MIPNTIRNDILARLRHAETEYGVRVLLAVESGSRAWGFASPNSDYDARFIYVHPRDWYLSVGLEEQRDVIEYPIVDDIDINGWDLRKALHLFWKSNPAFMEWIQSPIVYREEGSFATLAREAMEAVYSCQKGIYHYRSMAKTNYRGYLRAELVPLKKYFYVLRPLLAVRWLERFQQAAPIEFEKLLAVAPQDAAFCSPIFRPCWQRSVPRRRWGWNSRSRRSIPSSNPNWGGWKASRYRRKPHQTRFPGSTTSSIAALPRRGRDALPATCASPDQVVPDHDSQRDHTDQPPQHAVHLAQNALAALQVLAIHRLRALHLACIRKGAKVDADHDGQHARRDVDERMNHGDFLTHFGSPVVAWEWHCACPSWRSLHGTYRMG